MYERRIKVFIAIMCISLAGIVARLGYLQLVKGEQYRQGAKDLLQFTELLPAVRGRILDRNGRVLAFDRPCFDLCLDYRFMDDDPKWIRRQKRQIARRRGVSIAEAEDIYSRLAENTRRVVARAAGMPWQEVRSTVIDGIIVRFEQWGRRAGQTVREQRQAHPVVSGLDEPLQLEGTVGASVRPSGRRWYPHGAAACHVIGRIGQVSAAEQEWLNPPRDFGSWLWRMRTDRLLPSTMGKTGLERMCRWMLAGRDRLERLRADYLPGELLGKTGVERICEPVLRGRRGYRRFKRRGVLSDEEASASGRDVHVTLDIELQEALMRIFPAARTGSIVVLSVPDNEVLALVSVPTYDLNRFQENYADLMDNTVARPLLHRAVAALHPPGSTVKPLSAVAGLARGVIDGQTQHFCSGHLIPGAERPRCWNWKKGGHGWMDVVDAIGQSCNIFFYKVGQALGIDREEQWFRRFGFLDVPGTGLAEECPGRVGPVPPTEAKGVSRFLAIGQGPIVVTPLHVANAIAAIARNGEFRSAKLLREGGPEQIRRSVPASAWHFELVRRGMAEVVSRPGQVNTAFRDNGPQGLSVCGKTGTAEVPSRWVAGGAGRRSVTLRGNMVWFTGFAPRDDPQIAFAVVLEYVKGGSGGRTAAPVAAKVVRICQQFGYARPGRAMTRK